MIYYFVFFAIVNIVLWVKLNLANKEEVIKDRYSKRKKIILLIPPFCILYCIKKLFVLVILDPLKDAWKD